MNLQFLLHYSLHFLFPAVFALALYRKRWVSAYLVLLATMLIDLDHLLANPVFDPCRCGIGFHPLHSFAALVVYILGLFFSRTRLIAVGCVWHLATDVVDCYLSSLHCG